MTGDAILPRLFVFKFRDHFGQRAFLVKDPADGIEIVCFIGPRELDVGIAEIKSAPGGAKFFAQRRLGKNKEGAAMFPDEIGDGNAVDFRAVRSRAEAERIARG